MRHLNVSLFFALNLIFLFSCETEDFSPSGSSNTSITPGTYLYTTSVDQFTWVRGNSAYAEASKNRLYSSEFKFGNGSNFTYTFNFDGWLYKLYGEYFQSGNKYVFYAVRSTSTGGSGTQVVVEGTIEPRSNGRYKVQMEYGSSATYAATVNNTEFFNQASKRFRTTMTMEP